MMLINHVLLHVKRDDVPDARGSVIITHGIAEHSGRYDEITKELNKAGYSVVRYDLRGHGQSQGKRGALKSMNEPVEDLHALVMEEKKKKPKKIFLIGHSLGGLIVDLYGVTYKDTDGIISSAAPSYFVKDVLPLRILGFRWLGWMKKKTDFADDQLSRIKEVEEDYVNDPLNLKAFRFSIVGHLMVKGVRYLNRNVGNFMTPVLILHGEDDKIVPKTFSERFYDNIPTEDKKLIIYPGGYHEIFNDLDKKKVYADVIDWLDRRSGDQV